MQPKLRTIHFYGRDKKLFGVDSIQMAGDNMAVIWAGIFSRFGKQHKDRVASSPYHVKFGDNTITEDKVHELGNTKDIHLMPVLRGAGKAGAIVLGIVMIVIGVLAMPWTGGTSLAVAQAGMTIMSGIMMIYSAMNMPKMNNDNKGPEERASFVFSGAANVIEQGGAVPCLYGRFRTGSTVVSAGINTEELAAYTSPTGGNSAPDGMFGIIQQAV